MKLIADALQSIAVTLWVGGLWAIGLIVAPLLFHTLSDRSQAGTLAGQFFTTIRGRFAACHGVSSVLYLIEYALGLVMVLQHGRGR